MDKPLVFIVALQLAVGQPLKLELASVLFRHGDRSPTHAYPKDPYQEPFWPQGFGQLSTVGMRQEYFLGEVLKNKYVEKIKLIHQNYTRVQVYVRSTDIDRTLMSAESVLAALYPPKGDQIFNDSLPWQPIPVHTVPVDEDDILHAYSNCPAYTKLRVEDTQTQAYINLQKENENFFRSLEQYTGYESVNLTSVHSLYGVLIIEEIKNLMLPSWVNVTVMARLLNLTMYTYHLMFNSVTKQRLTAGNWIGKVVSDMKTRAEDPENETRLYLYSAHDTTLRAMMTALGVFDGEQPPYAAAFIIELYSNSSSGYWVSLSYRNETNGTHLWPLHVNSCRNITLCTLQEFIELSEPLVPSDWVKECGLTSLESENGIVLPEGVVILLGCLFGVTLLVLLVAVVCCVCLIVRSYRDKRLKYITKLHNP